MLKVSFYSYKGGAGRSTTAWNTIQRLVKILKPTPEEPFIIVDTDTESAGATYLYGADGVFDREEENKSIQYRMMKPDDTNYTDSSDSDKEKYFKTMFPVGTYFGLPESEDNAVLLIGVNFDEEKTKGADVGGKDKKISGEQMKNLSNNITRACKSCGAKALFFDTPTGTQFLAKRSIAESDIIVCCMRPTSQFRKGTRTQLQKFIEQDIENLEVGYRKYILTPTAICVDPNQEFGYPDKHNYPDKALKDIDEQFSCNDIKDDKTRDAFEKHIIRGMLRSAEDKTYKDAETHDKLFGIPEIKRFKWFEYCLGRLPESELTPNDKMAINQYDHLAQIILDCHKSLYEDS